MSMDVDVSFEGIFVIFRSFFIIDEYVLIMGDNFFKKALKKSAGFALASE